MGDSAYFESPGLQQQMGISTGKQELVGVVDASPVAVATSGAGSQDLKTSIQPANALSENNKGFKIRAGGTMAGVAGARTASITFGGTVVAQVVVPLGTAAAAWYLEATVLRAGASLQEAVGFGVAPGDICNATRAAPAAPTTAAITIAVNGNPADAGDTITATMLEVEFLN